MDNPSKFTPSTHYGNGLVEPRELALPNIPDAIYDEDHQGLLLVDTLTKPLQVECAVWSDARLGDTCQLEWDNVPIGTAKALTTEQPGDLLILEVPVKFLQIEGVHTVAYHVLYGSHGVLEVSAPMSLTIQVPARSP